MKWGTVVVVGVENIMVYLHLKNPFFLLVYCSPIYVLKRVMCNFANGHHIEHTFVCRDKTVCVSGTCETLNFESKP